MLFEKVQCDDSGSWEGKRLIFTSNIAQAEELSEDVYHSKTTDEGLIKFQNGQILKLALVNKGGTGATYKKVDHLILTQVDSDNNGLTSQKIARTLLKQEDYQAVIWVIVLDDTQDTIWLKSALKNFDKNKIKIIEFKNLILWVEENLSINKIE